MVADRRYSGKVTALIIVSIVVVFVLLNVYAERNVPRPNQPVPAPTVTARP